METQDTSSGCTTPLKHDQGHREDHNESPTDSLSASESSLSQVLTLRAALTQIQSLAQALKHFQDLDEPLKQIQHLISALQERHGRIHPFKHDHDLRQVLKDLFAEDSLAHVSKTCMMGKMQESNKCNLHTTTLRQRVIELGKCCQQLQNAPVEKNERSSEKNCSTVQTSSINRDPPKVASQFQQTDKVDVRVSTPIDRDDFLTDIMAETDDIAVIQEGLRVYLREICSGRFKFSKRFLNFEKEATAINIDKLDRAAQDLMELRDSVADMSDTVVPEELAAAFDRSQSAVAESRAVLVHSHVFFKVNFRLLN